MEWVSVKDRLPEYTTQARGSQFVVVLACVNGAVSECLYEEGVWKFMHIAPTEKVTHWMPLPEPPGLEGGE